MKLYNSLLLALALTTCLLGCKKNNGSSDPAPDPTTAEYYLTAKNNGQTWTANVSNNSLHTPVLGATTKSGNKTIMILLGIRAVNKDSTAFALIFPTNVTLNKDISFDASQYTEGAYATMTTGYNTIPANKGSGTINITSFDQTKKIIEGTFSGNFGSTNGGSTIIKVTDGKFRCPFTTDPNVNPFPPNVKF